jgi:hypothetical protein
MTIITKKGCNVLALRNHLVNVHGQYHRSGVGILYLMLSYFISTRIASA